MSLFIQRKLNILRCAVCGKRRKPGSLTAIGGGECQEIKHNSGKCWDKSCQGNCLLLTSHLWLSQCLVASGMHVYYTVEYEFGKCSLRIVLQRVRDANLTVFGGIFAFLCHCFCGIMSRSRLAAGDIHILSFRDLCWHIMSC